MDAGIGKLNAGMNKLGLQDKTDMFVTQDKRKLAGTSGQSTNSNTTDKKVLSLSLYNELNSCYL